MELNNATFGKQKVHQESIKIKNSNADNHTAALNKANQTNSTHSSGCDKFQISTNNWANLHAKPHNLSTSPTTTDLAQSKSHTAAGRYSDTTFQHHTVNHTVSLLPGPAKTYTEQMFRLNRQLRVLELRYLTCCGQVQVQTETDKMCLLKIICVSMCFPFIHCIKDRKASLGWKHLFGFVKKKKCPN